MTACLFALASNHTLFVKGLSHLLDGQEGWQVLFQASNGHDLVTQARIQPPDIILLGQELPDIGIEELMLHLKNHCPSSKIVLFLDQSDEKLVTLAFNEGIQGIVLKNISTEHLIQGLNLVRAGFTFQDKDIQGLLLNQTVKPKRALSVVAPQVHLLAPRDTTVEMSGREKEVLSLLAECKSNKEIAQLLHISTHTVKVHVAHIMQKLEADNRHQATQKAGLLGFLQKHVNNHHILLQRYFEQTNEIIWIKDKEGKYLLINAAGAKFLAKPAEEIIGKFDHQLFPIRTATEISASDRHVLQTGATEIVENTIVNKQGFKRIFQAIKTVLRDSDGETQGLIGTIRDITESALHKGMAKQLADSIA